VTACARDDTDPGARIRLAERDNLTMRAPLLFQRGQKMDESLVVRRETQIAAPPATVFAFLTDPEKILRWMGTEATTEAHPGGLYLVKGIDGRSNARGDFREVVPVHRLAYSFGWEGNEAVPPGSSLVEIDLIDRDGGTLLRMTHTGLPSVESRTAHARGWAHYLGRLSVAASGRDPGPDPGTGPSAQGGVTAE